MRISFVNGKYVNHASAAIHVEDRGYQFADGVYEYIAFYNRKLLDADLHLARLARSLQELEIGQPISEKAMMVVIRELIERNNREDGGLYIQVTRGVSKRDHPFPKNTRPALVMTICGAKTPKPQEVGGGVKVISAPDNRWDRRDIKSVSLLANVLAKQAAARANVREALLLGKNGIVHEGSVSNFFIVGNDGVLKTHPADNHILGGITRAVVLEIAKEAGIKIEEKPFTINEAKNADEAFITSTSANVLPVVKIDGNLVGNGKVGKTSKKLLELYLERVYKQTGKRI